MTLLAFLFAAVILAVTPGPGIAYVVARTAAGGRAERLAWHRTPRARHGPGCPRALRA